MSPWAEFMLCMWEGGLGLTLALPLDRAEHGLQHHQIRPQSPNTSYSPSTPTLWSLILKSLLLELEEEEAKPATTPSKP